MKKIVKLLAATILLLFTMTSFISKTPSRKQYSTLTDIEITQTTDPITGGPALEIYLAADSWEPYTWTATINVYCYYLGATGHYIYIGGIRHWIPDYGLGYLQVQATIPPTTDSYTTLVDLPGTYAVYEDQYNLTSWEETR